MHSLPLVLWWYRSHCRYASPDSLHVSGNICLPNMVHLHKLYHSPLSFLSSLSSPPLHLFPPSSPPSTPSSPRFKSARVTDQRVRIMNEVISGIRVIKMYAWEYAFKRIVTKLRRWVNKTDLFWDVVLLLHIKLVGLFSRSTTCALSLFFTLCFSFFPPYIPSFNHHTITTNG